MKERQLTALMNVYQNAISFKTHEGDLVWSRFNGFVVAHAFFFAIIGQIIFSHHFIYKYCSLLIISSFGALLGFFWLISTLRGFESVEFWTLTVIELATKIKNDYKVPNVFEKGNKYFKKNREVTFELRDEEEKIIQRSCITRLFHFNTRWTAYLSIGSIIVLYVIIIVATFAGKIG